MANGDSYRARRAEKKVQKVIGQRMEEHNDGDRIENEHVY
jgi:hypothetical protein